MTPSERLVVVAALLASLFVVAIVTNNFTSIRLSQEEIVEDIPAAIENEGAEKSESVSGEENGNSSVASEGENDSATSAGSGDTAGGAKEGQEESPSEEATGNEESPSEEATGNEESPSEEAVAEEAEPDTARKGCAEMPMNWNPLWSTVGTSTALPSTEYMMKGYHYLLGNPLARDVDVGWRSSNIFDSHLLAVQPSTATSPYVLPNYMTYRSVPSCSDFSHTSSSFSVAEFQSSLQGTVALSAGVDVFGFVQGSYSQNQDSQDVSQAMAKTSSFVATSQVLCSTMQLSWADSAAIPIAGQLAWTTYQGIPSNKKATSTMAPGSNFMSNVMQLTSTNTTTLWCNAPGSSDPTEPLPLQSVMNCWRWFFEYWGTHYPTSILYGGRSGMSRVIAVAANTTSAEVIDALGSSNAEGGNIVVDFFSASAHRGATSSSSSSSAKKSVINNSLITKSEFSHGGIYNQCPSTWNLALNVQPVPIKMSFRTIDNLLTLQFWHSSMQTSNGALTPSLLSQLQAQVRGALGQLCQAYADNVGNYTLALGKQPYIPNCSAEETVVNQSQVLPPLTAGFYQVDSCLINNTPNFLTQNTNCPNGYTAVKSFEILTSPSCLSVIYVCYNVKVASALPASEATLSAFDVSDFGGFFTLSNTFLTYTSCLVPMNANKVDCSTRNVTQWDPATFGESKGMMTSLFNPILTGYTNPTIGWYSCPQGMLPTLLGTGLSYYYASGNSNNVSVYACLPSVAARKPMGSFRMYGGFWESSSASIPLTKNDETNSGSCPIGFTAFDAWSMLVSYPSVVVNMRVCISTTQYVSSQL